jgi:hypothetical protein
VANCFYIAGTPCGNTTNPNCLCLPGFELVNGQCQPCKAGFFKGTNSSLPCTQWNTLQVCGQGYFMANGTRFTNAACLLSCPTPPGNATGKNSVAGCEWGCKAGYNNTAFKWGFIFIDIKGELNQWPSNEPICRSAVHLHAQFIISHVWQSSGLKPD